MKIEHQGKAPEVHATAQVAPTAVLSGEVRLGPGSCVGFGAVITAEGGPIEIGANCVIMENAVIRASRRHPTRIGDHVLVGPGAYLTGCSVAERAFLATRSSVFNGARVEAGAAVRINGTLHVNSRLPEGAVVPIGWVAVGDPAKILPPGQHDAIWAVQKDLDFSGTCFGVARLPDSGLDMVEITRRYAAYLQRHGDDRIL